MGGSLFHWRKNSIYFQRPLPRKITFIFLENESQLPIGLAL